MTTVCRGGIHRIQLGDQVVYRRCNCRKEVADGNRNGPGETELGDDE